MKNITSLALAGALTTAVASGAVTDPVGYTTESLVTGFNLVGVTLHEPTAATGTFTAVGAGTVTDGSATLTTALTGSTSWILEITSGAQSGAIQVFTSFTDTEITTPDDLAAAGVVIGDTYSIRAASTINSVFGADNEAGLQAADTPAGADIIWVPTGPGTYSQFYRNSGVVIPPDTVIVPPAWQTLGGAEAGDTVLAYTDGMFIERKGGPLDLVITGEVKLTSTRLVLPTGFTIASTAFPVGSTLDNSNLSASLTASDTPAGADIVWAPTGPGTYAQYYYNQGVVIPPNTVIVPPSWQTLGGAPAGTTEIPSAVFIERKGGLTSAEVAVPPYTL